MTPSDIQAIVASGQASNAFAPGDLFAVPMSGTVGALGISGTYYAQVLGLDHNSEFEGTNTMHLQLPCDSTGKGLAFVDSTYNSYTPVGQQGFYMNNAANSTNSTNVGGWNNSYARKTLMPQFLNAMAVAWRNAVKACSKYRDNTGGGTDTASYVTATQDKTWYLSEFEVQGARSYANSAEQNFQKQYAFYKNGGSKIHYKYNVVSDTVWWWLSSVYIGNSRHWCFVGTDGSPNYYDSGDSSGAVFGCVIS